VAGYAASARIRDGRPRLAGAERTDDPRDDPTARPEVEQIELSGPSLDGRLAAWWAGIRETWSETTFYLFDANSWR
jgi:hypothetical protein